MRVPMVLVESVNPYLASRAVFRLITSGTFSSGTYKSQPIAGHVKKIALPGLGTGVGNNWAQYLCTPGANRDQRRVAWTLCRASVVGRGKRKTSVALYK
jgi:hypothetical protein